MSSSCSSTFLAPASACDSFLRTSSSSFEPPADADVASGLALPLAEEVDLDLNPFDCRSIDRRAPFAPTGFVPLARLLPALTPAIAGLGVLTAGVSEGGVLHSRSDPWTLKNQPWGAEEKALAKRKETN